MKINLLRPQHLQDFKCIGPDCENTCCYGWNIFVDRKTYLKYRKVDNKKIKELFKSNIIRNRQSTGDWDYSKIQLKQDTMCPFLDENRLCEIHKNLGEKYLCRTCRMYPRIFNKVGDIYESTAYVSCPEIARVALLNPNKMEFDQMEVDIDEIIYSNKKVGIENEKLFWQLRIFTISILQERKYKIWQRLLILGLFYEKADAYISEKKIEDVLSLIESYKYLIEHENIEDLFNDIGINNTFQLEMMKILSDARTHFKIVDMQLKECLQEFNLGLGYEEEESKDEQIEKYKESYEEYYNQYMKDHEYILENYLVHYVFTELFPFGNKRGAFDEYAIMILHYSLIKTYLIGLAAYHKKLDDKLVIKLIHSVSRSFDHGNEIIELVFKNLRERNKMTMDNISLLLKN